MPIKTSSGKWKWGNVERSSKKELVQTVYGIWKKNGSKGSFSDFLKGTHESIEEQKESYFVTDLDYNKHIKPVLDILKKWNRIEIGNITKHADDKSMKWFGIYKGRSIEDIVALAAVYIDKADKEIFFNQINSGEKGMGKYLTDRMIEYFKKNKNGCDHISWLSDPGSGEKLKDFYRTNFPDAEETEEKNEWWQTSKFTLKLKESYEPPYTLDTIKQKYGDEVYRKLRDDPVHRFRAETGIEVIHKEPTCDEFERIVNNWDLMTPEQKKQSDEFSMKMFGLNNHDRIDNIRKSYMKKESLNEAHEIHSYPEKLQPTLERIVKDNEDYELDHAYFNKEGKFIWMRNSKGYFHIFKPVKFVKTPGMTKPFGFKDLILKDNGMLEEVDRLRFTDGNEGLKFLKDKYHLELKTIK